jgi:Holliday junction resolvase RusA-like endonuclease
MSWLNKSLTEANKMPLYISNHVKTPEIYPETRRYHVDNLLRQLVDYCMENGIVDEKNKPLINKNKFIKFCMRYTS